MWTRCERATLYLDFLAPTLHTPATRKPTRRTCSRLGQAVNGRASSSSTRTLSALVEELHTDRQHAPDAKSPPAQPSRKQARPQSKPLREIHGAYSYNVPLDMPYSQFALARQADAVQFDVLMGRQLVGKKGGRMARAKGGFDVWHKGEGKVAPGAPNTLGTKGSDVEEVEEDDSVNGEGSGALTITELRLLLLEPTLHPSFLLHLRPLVKQLTQRDVAGITQFLCDPSKCTDSFPSPSGIPWPQDSGKQGDMPPEQVELELALHCIHRSTKAHAPALRTVMLRHRARGSEGDAMVQRCWDEFIRVRGGKRGIDHLTGPNVREIVTIYLSMLASRAVLGFDFPDKIRHPLPPSLEIPFFAEALEIGLRIGKPSRGGSRPGQPLELGLADVVLAPYLDPSERNTLLNWLGAIQYARLARDGRKLYLYIQMLARNKKLTEVWELWVRTEEAVAGGWAVFSSGSKGEATGLAYWDGKTGVEENEEELEEEARKEQERVDSYSEGEDGYDEDAASAEDAGFSAENVDHPEVEAEGELEKLEKKLHFVEIQLADLENDAVVKLPINDQVTPKPATKNPEKSLFPISIVTPVQTAFLSSFLLLHRPDLTTAILTRLQASKIKLTTHHFSALLSGFAKRNMWAEAHRTWVMMEKQGVERDRVSWNGWLQTLFGDKQWRLGLQEFKKMREIFPEPGEGPAAKRKGKSAPVKGNTADKEPLGVGIKVWNTVLHGLFANDRTEEARLLWREMHRLGQVNIVSYNTVLKFQARKADWAGVARSLRGLKEEGMTPDAYTYTTILEAVAARPKGPGRMGVTRGEARIDSVQQGVHMVLSSMREDGVKANEVMVGKIIDVMVNGGREENIRATMALLEELELSEDRMLPPVSGGSSEDPNSTALMVKELSMDNPGSHLNEIIYTSCIVGIMRSTLDSATKRDLAAQLLQRMRARNIGANRVTYHVLIRGCFDGRAPAEAMSLWREQRSSGLSNKDTYYLIMRGLLNLKPNYDSSRVSKQAVTNSFIQSLSPSDKWEVPDGTREGWIQELATALEKDLVELVGSLRSAWNSLIASRPQYAELDEFS